MPSQDGGRAGAGIAGAAVLVPEAGGGHPNQVAAAPRLVPHTGTTGGLIDGQEIVTGSS